MAFSYTNTTAADQVVTSKALGLATNYARVADEPTLARISNKTASLEQPELITIRSNPINKVSTAIAVRNPSPVSDGVQYSIKLETVDRVTVGTETIDEPVAAWLTIKHPASNNWTNAKVAEIVVRLLSACMKGQTTTGTPAEAAAANWRFEDLMKSALMPTTD